LADQVPLPLTDPSEPGFFHFLSKISLHKLFAELLETLGYKSKCIPLRTYYWFPTLLLLGDQNTDAHQEQSSAWYQSLAPSLKFLSESTPILDPHKAFLKGQYHFILAIANCLNANRSHDLVM
jgi:hypothetical protein